MGRIGAVSPRVGTVWGHAGDQLCEGRRRLRHTAVDNAGDFCPQPVDGSVGHPAGARRAAPVAGWILFAQGEQDRGWIRHLPADPGPAQPWSEPVVVPEVVGSSGALTS